MHSFSLRCSRSSNVTGRQNTASQFYLLAGHLSNVFRRSSDIRKGNAALSTTTDAMPAQTHWGALMHQRAQFPIGREIWRYLYQWCFKLILEDQGLTMVPELLLFSTVITRAAFKSYRAGFAKSNQSVSI